MEINSVTIGEHCIIYVFNKLIDFAQAKDVSDHYPIELALETAPEHTTGPTDVTITEEEEGDVANAAADTGCCGLTALIHRFTAWSRKKLEL